MSTLWHPVMVTVNPNYGLQRGDGSTHQYHLRQIGQVTHASVQVGVHADLALQLKLCGNKFLAVCGRIKEHVGAPVWRGLGAQIITCTRPLSSFSDFSSLFASLYVCPYVSRFLCLPVCKLPVFLHCCLCVCMFVCLCLSVCLPVSLCLSI